MTTLMLTSNLDSYITNSQVTALGLCHQVNKTGTDTCCCTGCPAGSKWSQPCDGDLPGPVCNANEILGSEPDGQAYFGDSHPIDLPDVCYSPGLCHTQKYQYIYQCCSCPSGYQPLSYSGNCDTGAMCVGCNGPNEVLSGNVTAGFTCTVPPDPCPSLATISVAGLDSAGSQIVVDKSFATDVQNIISCWTKNTGAKVNATTSSRCSASSSITPTTDHQSDHFIGRAIDINLEFPSTAMGAKGLCNSTCMSAGYCAYHKTASQCAAYQNQAQNAQNKMVNDFFTCAANLGVWVGAAHGADSGHFERDVANFTAAYPVFQKQLKAFCLGQCQGVKKGMVGALTCNCAGYS